MFHTPNREKVQTLAHNMRIDVIKMIHEAGSGHPGGSLGMADVFSTLYFSGVMKYDPKNPKMTDRDIVILSNAHISPIYYSVLAHAGYFETNELMVLRKFGSRLQGHSTNHFPEIGIESSGGPLGQGMSVAVGFALSSRLTAEEKNRQVFCFCSDGELNEGQAWEAVMSAVKFKLKNLTFIIDRNNIQIDGKSDDIMPLEPLQQKFRYFGCDVLDVDGHDVDKIFDALTHAKDQAKMKENDKPTVLIMHTTPGKGVSFMENNFKWHGKSLNDEDFNKALQELGV